MSSEFLMIMKSLENFSENFFPDARDMSAWREKYGCLTREGSIVFLYIKHHTSLDAIPFKNDGGRVKNN